MKIRPAKIPGSGRKKGCTNLAPRSVKEFIALVFNELQTCDAKGLPRHPSAHMLTWAKSEPTEFYKIAAKLIPTEVSGQVSHTVNVVRFAPTTEVPAIAEPSSLAAPARDPQMPVYQNSHYEPNVIENDS